MQERKVDLLYASSGRDVGRCPRVEGKPLLLPPMAARMGKSGRK